MANLTNLNQWLEAMTDAYVSVCTRPQKLEDPPDFRRTKYLFKEEVRRLVEPETYKKWIAAADAAVAATQTKNSKTETNDEDRWNEASIFEPLQPL